MAFHRAAQSRMVAAIGLAIVAMLGIFSLGILRPQVIGEVMFAALLVNTNIPIANNGDLITYTKTELQLGADTDPTRHRGQGAKTSVRWAQAIRASLSLVLQSHR